LAETSCDLPEIAQQVNAGLLRETRGEVFVTAFLGRLDPLDRSLTWLNAGHPEAFVLDATGKIKSRLASTSLPLAIQLDGEFPTNTAVQLEAGDLVFFYTDGLPDAHPPKAPLFGIERALQLIQANRDRTAEEIIETLCHAAHQYAGPRKPHDDITVVIIKVLGNAQPSSSALDQVKDSEATPTQPGSAGRRRNLARTRHFTVEQSGGITIVRLADLRHFDTEKYVELQRELLELVEHQQPGKLLVDLGNVKYCMTALISTLLTTQKRVQAGLGTMKLCSLQEVLRQAMECSKLIGTTFSVYADEATAKNSF
jgi:anti-anti-sigma factor